MNLILQSDWLGFYIQYLTQNIKINLFSISQNKTLLICYQIFKYITNRHLKNKLNFSYESYRLG